MEASKGSNHSGTLHKFKYRENLICCKRLKKRLQESFVRLYAEGGRKFLVGGALGVGLWSGEILIRLKEQPEYSELHLILAIPFEGHDADWGDRSRKRLAFCGCTQKQ